MCFHAWLATIIYHKYLSLISTLLSLFTIPMTGAPWNRDFIQCPHLILNSVIKFNLILKYLKGWALHIVNTMQAYMFCKQHGRKIIGLEMWLPASKVSAARGGPSQVIDLSWNPTNQKLESSLRTWRRYPWRITTLLFPCIAYNKGLTCRSGFWVPKQGDVVRYKPIWSQYETHMLNFGTTGFGTVVTWNGCSGRSYERQGGRLSIGISCTTCGYVLKVISDSNRDSDATVWSWIKVWTWTLRNWTQV